MARINHWIHESAEQTKVGFAVAWLRNQKAGPKTWAVTLAAGFVQEKKGGK